MTVLIVSRTVDPDEVLQQGSQLWPGGILKFEVRVVRNDQAVKLRGERLLSAHAP
ncbi:hypothetical protein IB277_34450 [Ensifer sp. ENS07]|uniref:hypothetical protein n=1 Tax=Ensifer sp. ENS07 TaxID=2769274 RepID=UPI00177EA7D3|nr:hypothetical protein [Ensifer sp. ENS07]MBD9641401.1 hypothetical protein [Ensifer sp. ENS07]